MKYIMNKVFHETFIHTQVRHVILNLDALPGSMTAMSLPCAYFRISLSVTYAVDANTQLARVTEFNTGKTVN